MASPLNLDNIQGDILSGLPKKGEIFFFFQINKDLLQDFCTGVGQLAHHVTSVTQCEDDRQKIVKEKERAALHDTTPKLLELSGINIAFSHKGLKALGIRDPIGDDVFVKGMVADADGEDRDVDGEGEPSKYLNDDLSQWEPEFRDEEIHGVILITGSSHPKLKETLSKVKSIFKVGRNGASITEVTHVEGHVRPGDVAGHEHFGFADGIAQPAVDGVPTLVHRGTDTIHQGIILVGRPGDALRESRPSWALDGSFLVFRKLKQKVPEFQKFLDVEGPKNRLTPDLLGAKLVGRWKNGAPVENFPLEPASEDDKANFKAAAKDSSQNDNFRYQQNVKQKNCPYAAHTRKTNPRDDFPFNIDAHQEHRIIRRGIQYVSKSCPFHQSVRYFRDVPSHPLKAPTQIIKANLIMPLGMDLKLLTKRLRLQQAHQISSSSVAFFSSATRATSQKGSPSFKNSGQTTQGSPTKPELILKLHVLASTPSLALLISISRSQVAKWSASMQKTKGSH
ncbi:hypothetical protein ONS95_007599 [Cadophora gregata]|uniref:uncharacterized protein n=1 Tax=Cadophora gregata TaxID=51156 RepID=UPI0026DBC136|nr:uncharacterized protein ONS95_007599 [Cadophora gregata]KAK0125976.1 hypothetical protein ONS95_007599 [Cadophora gregata]